MIRKRLIPIIIIASALVVAIAAFLCVIIFQHAYSRLMTGSIGSYYTLDDAKANDLRSKDDFIDANSSGMHMPKSAIDDLFINPQNYTEYAMDVCVKNDSAKNLFVMSAYENDVNKEIWFDNSTFCMDDTFLVPGDSSEGVICFMVKTSDINQKQLDKIMNNLKVAICYTTSATPGDRMFFPTERTVLANSK